MLSTVFKILVLLLVLNDQYGQLAAAPVINDDFEAFITTYNKSYASPEEKAKRADIFAKNVQDIKKHNEQADAGVFTWYEAVNQNSDLTQDEYLSKFEKIEDIHAKFNVPKPNLALAAARSPGKGKFAAAAASTAPADFDWRTQPGNFVNPIRNQGAGSVDVSGAFAGIAAIESAYAIRKGTLPQLSEQHSISCAMEPISPVWTLVWGVAVGVAPLSSVPYTGSVTYNCSRSLQSTIYAATQGYTVIGSATLDTERLKNVVRKYGLVGVGIDAAKLQAYSSGIIPDTAGSTYTYTYANIVGWKTTGQSTPYWILRYSKGTNWGENGYFRIAMTTNGNSWFATKSPMFMADFYQ